MARGYAKGCAMGHEMFDFNRELTDAVFDYCRDRLSVDPSRSTTAASCPCPRVRSMD